MRLESFQAAAAASVALALLAGAAKATMARAGPAPERVERPSVRSLDREGEDWVETLAGSFEIAPARSVRIITRGEVRVQGVREAGLRYALELRVRAGSPGEARRRLDSIRVTRSRRGDVAIVRVDDGGDAPRLAAITVWVPSDLRSVEVDTRGGTVAIADVGGGVAVRTGAGRVDLDRIGGSAAAVSAGGEITLGSIGGGVRAATAGGSIRAREIGRDAFLETGGGEIDIGRVRGAVRAATAGGAIRVERAGATAELVTAGGAIRVGEAAGRVSARSRGGPILIQAAQGVACESAGGSIRLLDVSGPVRARTSAGDILARLSGGSSPADSLLSTEEGDITLLVPAGSPLTILAENGSVDRERRIVSELAGFEVRTVGARAVGTGRILGGGPVMRLRGTGGTIYIKSEEPSGP